MQTASTHGTISTTRVPTWVNWASAGAIALGILFRLSQYLANRSLWIDEALVINPILKPDFWETVRRGTYESSMPLGMGILIKLICYWSESEYALRSLSLCGGIGSLLALYPLAKRSIRPISIPIAIGLMAVSDSLIYFSSELKQYSTDVLLTELLLLGALSHWRDPGSIGKSVVLGLGGAVAVWLSHSSVFVLAGLGAVTLYRTLVRRDAWKLPLLIAVSWGLSFSFYYFFSLRQIAAIPSLVQYWTDLESFVPRTLSRLPTWLGTVLSMIFTDLLGFSGVLGSLLFAVGCYGWSTKERELPLGALLLPFLFALTACFFRWYPFSPRLLLFLTPLASLLVAEGVAKLLPRGRRGLALAILLLPLLFFQSIPSAILALGRPRLKEELKPVLQGIAAEPLGADVLYVYHGAVPAFNFYSRSIPVGSRMVSGMKARAEPRNYLADIDEKTKGTKRFWVVFSHVHASPALGMAEDAYLLGYLNGRAKRIKSIKGANAHAALYERRPERDGIPLALP